MTHALVARLDNFGDVLVSGPAVRAVAAGSDRVTFLAGPGGVEAAALLPGIDEVMTFAAPWVGYEPEPFDSDVVARLVADVSAASIDRAVVLTSFHQSALPLALLLRMAGVQEIAATSIDYAGSLLALRHPYLDDVHEVEQALSLVETFGYRLPPGDDRSLRIQHLGAVVPELPPEYVVVHPGASVPARALAPDLAAAVVERLAESGRVAVVTGTASERGLAAGVIGPTDAVDLSGRIDLRQLAAVLGRATALVCGNTGPAHLAAAVGTPVVQVFAPVVPASRWRPWRVPSIVLGDQSIACAGCRARICPFEYQRCTAGVTAPDVVAAVDQLTVTQVEVPV
jgi:ADP-heptose:LPS heptosyltransferase